jgi:hypothetical protein
VQLLFHFHRCLYCSRSSLLSPFLLCSIVMSKSNNLGGFDPLASGNAVPSSTPPVSSHPPLDARQLQFLQQQGFSSGLIRALSTHSFPLRIWILDNSGAMTVNDSHRISGTFDNLQNLPVTRWEELQDCVAYHSQMAALFAFPTRFAVSCHDNNASSCRSLFFCFC